MTEPLVRSHRAEHFPGDNDSLAAEVARRELAAAVAAFLPPTPGQWLPKGYGTNAPAIRGPVGHEPRPGRAPPGRLTNRRRQACAQLAGGHQSEGNDHA